MSQLSAVPIGRSGPAKGIHGWPTIAVPAGATRQMAADKTCGRALSRHQTFLSRLARNDVLITGACAEFKPETWPHVECTQAAPRSVSVLADWRLSEWTGAWDYWYDGGGRIRKERGRKLCKIIDWR